jgi:hypothetical protein
LINPERTFVGAVLPTEQSSACVGCNEQAEQKLFSSKSNEAQRFCSDIASVFQRSRALERNMNDHQRPWLEDKAMRVTCYLLVALAITVSVTLSIIEILR